MFPLLRNVQVTISVQEIAFNYRIKILFIQVRSDLNKLNISIRSKLFHVRSKMTENEKVISKLKKIVEGNLIEA
jgi:hypothetical protein